MKLSISLETWQDSRPKKDPKRSKKNDQVPALKNSVHSTEGLQQLRADSDHPKGVA